MKMLNSSSNVKQETTHYPYILRKAYRWDGEVIGFYMPELDTKMELTHTELGEPDVHHEQYFVTHDNKEVYTLSAFVRVELIRRGMTLTDLARISKVNSGLLTNMTANRRVSKPTIYRVAVALGIDPAFLMTLPVTLEEMQELQDRDKQHKGFDSSQDGAKGRLRKATLGWNFK